MRRPGRSPHCANGMRKAGTCSSKDCCRTARTPRIAFRTNWARCTSRTPAQARASAPEAPMLLAVTHETRYEYTPAVRTAQHLAHLKPTHDARQQLVSHELE